MMDESYVYISHWRITIFNNRFRLCQLQPLVRSFRYVKTSFHLYYTRDNVRIRVECFSLCSPKYIQFFLVFLPIQLVCVFKEVSFRLFVQQLKIFLQFKEHYIITTSNCNVFQPFQQNTKNNCQGFLQSASHVKVLPWLRKFLCAQMRQLSVNFYIKET